jgi:hypothetical protein
MMARGYAAIGPVGPVVTESSRTVGSTAQTITVETDSCGGTVILLDGAVVYSTPAPPPPPTFAEADDVPMWPSWVPLPVRPLRHQVLDRRDPRLLRHVLSRSRSAPTRRHAM